MHDRENVADAFGVHEEEGFVLDDRTAESSSPLVVVLKGRALGRRTLRPFVHRIVGVQVLGRSSYKPCRRESELVPDFVE